MFSLLVRRAIFNVARATRPQPFLFTAFKSPNISNRPFSSSPQLLFAAAKASAGIKVPKLKTSAKGKKDATKKKKKTVAKARPSTEPKPKPKPEPKKLKVPTRRMTSFNLFVRDRAQGKKAAGRVQLPAIVQEWKTLPESEKESYIKAAEEERSKKLKVFQQFVATADPKDLRSWNMQRRKMGKSGIRFRSPATKSSPNGFMLFMHQLRATPEMKIRPVTEVAIEAGKRWKVLDDKQKAEFVDAAIARRADATA